MTSTEAAASTYGSVTANRMFENRKGHGGGACTYRQLRAGELRNMLAEAFMAGARHGSTYGYADAPR